MSRTIATLDIGSNSIHLLILRVEPDLHFRVVDRMREMVRMGESVFNFGYLTPPVMERAMEAVVRMARLARLKQAEPLLAVATAAVREAANGGEFLQALHERHGIAVRVITGEQEARMIYGAARRAVTLGKSPALFIDIGGGSVELTAGDRDTVHESVSLKLGVLRLKGMLGRKDPPSAKAVARLRREIAKQVRPIAARYRRYKLSSAVLSAGTCEATDRLAWPDAAEGLSRAAAGVHRVAALLPDLSPRRRSELPGHDPKRDDITVPGAILVSALFRAFGIRRYQLSAWGLREGVALDYLERRRKSFAAANISDDVRRQSVLELSRLGGELQPHGRQTAHLTLALFDRLKPLHRLNPALWREPLEYAALLHDIGHHIHGERHHKHTQYLICNAPLRGFTAEEIKLIAMIARYHRRSEPSAKDGEFAALAPAQQLAVKRLAALLRFADACDRSHNGLVGGFIIRHRARRLRITLRAREDAQLELWAAQQQTGILESAFNLDEVTVAASAARKK